jgi:hypothetical protein
MFCTLEPLAAKCAVHQESQQAGILQGLLSKDWHSSCSASEQKTVLGHPLTRHADSIATTRRMPNVVIMNVACWQRHRTHLMQITYEGTLEDTHLAFTCKSQ